MVIQEAIGLFKEHQKGTVKKSTLKSYGKFLDQFMERFSACEVISISADQIGRFLEECTESLSRSTRHLRYAQIKAFFNYVIEVAGLNAIPVLRQSWPRHTRTQRIVHGRFWIRRLWTR
jgi:site-specific recombinase XerD